MMLVKGRYARVTKEGLKTSGLDGMITGFDFTHVTLKLIGSNIKSVRVRRENITIHAFILYKSNASDPQIGTIKDTFFTPNMTNNPQKIANTKFVPFFFKAGDTVRFMKNSFMDEAEIVHVNVLEGRLTLRHEGMLHTRSLTDVCLPKEKKEPVFIKPSIVESAELTTVSYEMTVLKKSGEKITPSFSSKEQMQKYLDKLVNPDTVIRVTYREVKKVYSPVMTVGVKTITKFEV